MGLTEILLSSVLVIKSGTTVIPPHAYQDRQDVTEVAFEEPSEVKEIGEYAFLGCSNLRMVNLPASLEKIGEGAFRE